MNKNYKYFSGICLMTTLLVILLCGCYPYLDPRMLASLQLGMSKDDVRVVAKPTVVRGSTLTPSGSVKETWEYLTQTDAEYGHGWTHKYWLTFIDGKLVQWGEPGDYGNSVPPTSKVILDINQKSEN